MITKEDFEKIDPNALPEVLSHKDIEKIFRVSERTVFRWRDRQYINKESKKSKYKKKFPDTGIRTKKKWLYRSKDIYNYVWSRLVQVL